MATLDPAERLARWSLATGVVVFLLKGVAWRLTGSVALRFDALECIVSLVASFAMLFAVRISRPPPPTSTTLTATVKQSTILRSAERLCGHNVVQIMTMVLRILPRFVMRKIGF